MPSTVVSSLTIHPVVSTCQRKNFYAVGRFWVFYSSGTNIYFKSSTNGTTWSAPSIALGIADYGWKFSLWFDGYYVHLTRRETAAAGALFYRRGVPNSGGSISWDTEVTASPAETSTDKNVATITKDSNGYPWIAYSRSTTAYRCRVAKATALDGSSWPSEPWTELEAADSTMAVVILPLTNGKMYAVWINNAPATNKEIHGKYYNGSAWDAGVTTITQAGGTTDYVKSWEKWGVSVDANDKIHLVYLDTSNNVKYRKCTNPSTNTWTAPTQLNDGSDTGTATDPTITVAKNSNQDLYVFWHNSTTIYKKVYTGGAWQAKTTWVSGELNIMTDNPFTSYFEDYAGYIAVLWQTTGINVRHEYLHVTSLAVAITEESISVADAVATAIPMRARAPTEAIAVPDNFISNGAGQPMNFVNFPSSVYWNGRTYIAWGGGINSDPYVAYFQHNTRQWVGPVKVGNSPYQGDDHEDPAIHVDSAGYLHIITGGAHTNCFINHYKSTNPENIATWTTMPNIVDNTTPNTPISGGGVAEYPKIIINGSDMYFFYKYFLNYEGIAYGAIWLRISHDNGATWENPVKRINYGTIGGYQAGIYQGHCVFADNKIHMTWVQIRTNDGYIHQYRKNVYHAYYDINDDYMHSMTGQNFGQGPISIADQETYCKIVDTGSEDSNHAALRCDIDYHPWIVYLKGPTDGHYEPTGVISLYHINWTGGNWITPKLITNNGGVGNGVGNTSNYADFDILSYTNVLAYVVIGIPNTIGQGWQNYRGGDIEQWWWDGWQWVKLRTVKSGVSATNTIYGNPMVPANYPPGLGVIFSQLYPSRYARGGGSDPHDGTLEIYAYDGGITDVPGHPGVTPGRVAIENLGLLTDNTARQIRLPRPITEPSISVADSWGYEFLGYRALAENISFSEVVLINKKIGLTPSENIGEVMDTPAFNIRRTTIITETISNLADYVSTNTRRIIIKLEPTISVLDAVLAILAITGREISEPQISILDSIDYQSRRTILISEPSMSLSDAVDYVLRRERTVAEPSISLTDETSVIISTLFVSRFISEDLGFIIDVPSVGQFKERTLTESLGLLGETLLLELTHVGLPPKRLFSIAAVLEDLLHPDEEAGYPSEAAVLEKKLNP